MQKNKAQTKQGGLFIYYSFLTRVINFRMLKIIAIFSEDCLKNYFLLKAFSEVLGREFDRDKG